MKFWAIDFIIFQNKSSYSGGKMSSSCTKYFSKLVYKSYIKKVFLEMCTNALCNKYHIITTAFSTVALCTSNSMFKREIWDKFTEFTFLKFWNLPSEIGEISKFQKMKEVNFPQILRINMWFLVNHMWQALKDHTRLRITQKTINQYQQIQ